MTVLNISNLVHATSIKRSILNTTPPGTGTTKEACEGGLWEVGKASNGNGLFRLTYFI